MNIIEGKSFAIIERGFSSLNFSGIYQIVEWEQKSLTLYGKTHLVPRLTASYGARYSYSGIDTEQKQIPDFLMPTYDRVSEAAQTDFNSVLLNLYRDGSDGIAWHQDNEPGLGINPTIVSISLGADRLFKLKHKVTGQVVDTLLQHGDLLIMGGACQAEWLHSIPKTKRFVGQRISLTFRKVL